MIYIMLGMIGIIAHWAKKRFIDETTQNDFSEYLIGNYRHTIYAIISIVFAELNLSFLQVGDVISLQEVISALTLGYTLDSGINRSGEFK